MFVIARKKKKEKTKTYSRVLNATQSGSMDPFSATLEEPIAAFSKRSYRSQALAAVINAAQS